MLFIVSHLDQFYIPGTQIKSDGTKRQLYKPKWSLKVIQKEIAKLLIKVPLSENVHGWVKKKSIQTAALQHIGKRYLYHYDIDDYFDCIGSKLIYSFFVQGLGCSPSIGRILTQISTFKHCLPQGSPCSPVIANLVLVNFDNHIARYANKRTGVYTRFGDNLIISSNNRLKDVKWVVEGELRRIGLRMNKDKEINAAEIQKSGVRVIGLVIGSRLSVSRKFRVLVRAVMRETGKENPSLVGKIRYIQRFHPEFK